MSSVYLNSNDIKIFPAANRSFKYDAQSRLMSEVNLTSIIRALGPGYSFVISKDKDEVPFKFILNGYYIEANIAALPQELIQNNSAIYANIVVKVDDSTDLSVLQGVDSTQGDDLSGETSVYTGVQFTSEPLSVDDTNFKVYSLKILDYANSNYTIPEISLYRYDYFDYSFDIIDCGNYNDPVNESELQKIYSNFKNSDWKLA